MITVHATDGSKHTYLNSSGWHVDDFGDLHIRKSASAGNIATHARHLWASVADQENPPKED